MKRLIRLTSIVSLLQSKRYTTISEIKDRFDISERTAYRDLRSLTDAGTPIGFDEEHGYFIPKSEFLAPLALTIDEAKAFLFADKIAMRYLDKKTYESYTSGLEKIKSKLKEDQLADIDKLEAMTRTYVSNSQVDTYLSTIQSACAAMEIVDIKYQNANGQFSERLVEPIGITFYGNTWHLIGFCQLRNDYRDFAFTRIKELSNTAVKFFRHHLSLAEYIEKLK